MGKQISKNIPRILTLFIVAILISSVVAAFDDRDSSEDSHDSPMASMNFDHDLGKLGNGEWFKFLDQFHPENMTKENKTSDRDNNGGPGYGGYGGAVVPVPMYGSPMYGSPMYGSEPSMIGSEPSTTAVPNSESNVCKGKVSSSKCHKGKCALSKHKHKHKNHSNKHKAEKNC
jgi:hypothetical protein